MAEVRVTVLAIGQGSASLLEVWEGDSYEKRSNLFVALMDCGSDDNKIKQNVKDSIFTIKDAMNRHSDTEGFTPPYLDVLIISHQDKDHWDKLDMLFEEVNGKRTINALLSTIETCIQKPAVINNLVFPVTGVKILAGQEQYSKIKGLFSQTALYEGSQHLQIGDQEYYTNIEYSYNYLFKITSYTLQFEIDDPYLEISVSYNCNKKSNWSFVMEDIDELYNYYFDQSLQLYVLLRDSQLIGFPSDWDVAGVLKETMDNLITRTGVNISSDIIVAIFTTYNNLLDTLTCDKVVAIIDNNLDLKCFIGQTFIGGQEDIYSKSFKNMRDRIKAVTSTGIEQLIGNQTNREIYNNHELGVKCSVLCCTKLSNCKLSGGGSGRSLEHNASSAVVQWEISGVKVLYPGDATVHTMHYMQNENLTKKALNCVLFAPHHGSGTTSGIANKSGSSDPWELLEKFLNSMQPQQIYISAGENNRHGHPNLSFVNKSEAVLRTKTADLHYICYNTQMSGNTGRDYRMAFEVIPLYTTVIYNIHGQTINMPCSFFINMDNKDKLCEEDSFDQVASEITAVQAVPFAEEQKQEKKEQSQEQQERIIRTSVIDLNQVNFLEDGFERR
jgi:hypothetical protein